MTSVSRADWGRYPENEEFRWVTFGTALTWLAFFGYASETRQFYGPMFSDTSGAISPHSNQPTSNPSNSPTLEPPIPKAQPMMGLVLSNAASVLNWLL